MVSSYHAERAKEDRIGIFQANFPVDSQTVNLAIMLADTGFDVDLFLFGTSNDWGYAFHEAQRLNHYPHINVINFAAEPIGQHEIKALVRRVLPLKVYRVLSICRSFLRRAWESFHPPTIAHIANTITPPSIVEKAIAYMDDTAYHCLIGIEKGGLLWAGTVAERLGARYFYYSLELYVEDYGRIRLSNDTHFEHQRSAERHFHSRSAGTIIQDAARAQVLLEANGLPWDEAKIFLLPVSVLGSPCTERSRFFHERFSLPHDKKIILYFGGISEQRLLLDLVDVAQRFPDDWVLIIHGWGPTSSIENIRRRDLGNRVLFSIDLIPSADVPSALASADIGLALYSDDIKNDSLTAFSSAKMALYMQSGVPFVAFDYPGYDRLAREDQCGQVISAMAELPRAVKHIFNAKELFRQNAFRAFSRYYDFAANFNKICGRLRQSHNEAQADDHTLSVSHT